MTGNLTLFRSAGALIFHDCDEGSLVFAEETGTTCVLTDTQAALLSRLAAGPTSFDAIADASIIEPLLDAGLIVSC